MQFLHFNMASGAKVLLCLSIILFAGFLVTRISKILHLPNVSGYIIAGVLIGPSVLKLVPAEVVSGMDFVSDIALAFIAFGVGRFFKKEALKNTGGKVFLVTLSESLPAGLLTALAIHFMFSQSWSFSILLGAIATATAPASTMMTIKQYRAEGPFVNTLLQVVALDDVIALAAFGVAAAVIQGQDRGVFSFMAVAAPILFNLLGIVCGGFCGWCLFRLLTAKRSQDNRLILTVAFLTGLSGLCCILDISPLLSCMAMGAVYVNLAGEEALFSQLDGFTPPIFSCFFVLSGMRLDLGALKVCGLMGIAYFLVRIAGKYAGAWLGCRLCQFPRPIQNWLGVALIPQAGVSIGLAVLGQRILPPASGALLSTVILSSSILYELMGPACAKLALKMSGAIDAEDHGKPLLSVK